MIDVADMPPDVLSAFELYLDGARRNVSEVARLRGIPRPTAQRWSERWRWKDRAASIDRDQTDAAIADARARHARRLTGADAVIGLALRARIGPDGIPYSTDDKGSRVDAPAPMAVRTALATYANHGIKPPQHVTLDVTHTALSASVTDAELDALIARLIADGDTASLLALNAGTDPRTILDSLPPLNGNADPTAPPVPYALPPDFTNSHPDGRAGPGPTLPMTVDAEFRENGMNGVADGELIAEVDLNPDIEG